MLILYGLFTWGLVVIRHRNNHFESDVNLEIWVKMIQSISVCRLIIYLFWTIMMALHRFITCIKVSFTKEWFFYVWSFQAIRYSGCALCRFSYLSMYRQRTRCTHIATDTFEMFVIYWSSNPGSFWHRLMSMCSPIWIWRVMAFIPSNGWEHMLALKHTNIVFNVTHVIMCVIVITGPTSLRHFSVPISHKSTMQNKWLVHDVII